MRGGQAASWTALIELVPALGDHWLLIGGQMVFLHEIERQATEIRATNDIDVVVDLRAAPSGLAMIHDALLSACFVQDLPAPNGTAHRFRRGAATIDVLAPDNIGPRARLRMGAGRTIQAPGTTQAFRRSEVVVVELEGRNAAVRRPDLVGALLGKAAAVTKIRSQTVAQRTKHVHDVNALARLLGVPDRLGAALAPSERKVLEQLSSEPAMSPLALAQFHLLLKTEHR